MSFLVSATDAGGAANVASVAALLPQSQRHVYCTQATERYFHSYGIYDLTRWETAPTPAEVMDDVQPQAVLCGTAGYPSQDRALLREAQRHKAATVAILDEWYRYIERFLDPDDSEPYFPTVLCVPDDLARAEAAAAGIPEETMVVTGSPALAAVCDRVEGYEHTIPALPDIRPGTPRPWIVFLSETHAAGYSAHPGQRGPLGPFLGYTEWCVAADIVKALADIASPCTLIEKRHPSDTSPLRALSLAPGQAWRSVGRLALGPLLWHADLVVGMRSVALIESALCGRPTLSFQPGLLPPHQPSTAERVGLVESARSAADLIAWLRRNWHRSSCRRPVRPAFAAHDAAARVHDILLRA